MVSYSEETGDWGNLSWKSFHSQHFSMLIVLEYNDANNPPYFPTKGKLHFPHKKHNEYAIPSLTGLLWATCPYSCGDKEENTGNISGICRR